MNFPGRFMNEVLVWWWKASNKQNSESSRSLKFYKNLKQNSQNQLNECTAITIHWNLTRAHNTSLAERKIQKFPLLTRKHFFLSFMFILREEGKEYKTISFSAPRLRVALFSFIRLSQWRRKQLITSTLCVHQQLHSTSHKSSSAVNH